MPMLFSSAAICVTLTFETGADNWPSQSVPSRGPKVRSFSPLGTCGLEIGLASKLARSCQSTISAHRVAIGVKRNICSFRPLSPLRPRAAIRSPEHHTGSARNIHRPGNREVGSAGPPVPVMNDTADTANVIIRPPIAWALAVLAGLALQWIVGMPFMPASVPVGWIGGMVFVAALALVAWAIATITRAGSNVPTNMPTTTIVETGPYRFTRNPIYLGMCLGLVGLAVAFNNLWLLGALVPFDLVIRYGVVAREEVYLDDQA